MRILHLGAGNLFGGVEQMLLTLARCSGVLSQIRTEFEFGLCFQGKCSEELLACGAKVHQLPAVRLSKPWTVLAARRALRRLIATERYDAVVTHSCWPHVVFAPVTRKMGVPLALWLHDPPNESLHWIEHLARRYRPGRVICNSRYTASLVDRLFDGVSRKVVHCPVETPRGVDDLVASRASFRAQHGASPEDVVILQVGRWERHKGHLNLLAALERLAQRSELPRWVCWQVGQPQRDFEQKYFDEVKEAAARRGLADRVKFLGWVPDASLCFAAADIYCQVNLTPEPFGITYVEAMYHGLPVIAAAEGGPLEIVAPETGMLIDPNRPEQLASALETLISDNNRRQLMGARAIVRAKELCDPARQISKLIDALRDDAQLPTQAEAHPV